MNASRHEVMAPIAQNANDFGGQRIVEKLEHRSTVGGIARRYRTVLDMLSSALAQSLDVGQKVVLGDRSMSRPGLADAHVVLDRFDAWYRARVFNGLVRHGCVVDEAAQLYDTLERLHLDFCRLRCGIAQ